MRLPSLATTRITPILRERASAGLSGKPTRRRSGAPRCLLCGPPSSTGSSRNGCERVECARTEYARSSDIPSGDAKAPTDDWLARIHREEDVDGGEARASRSRDCELRAPCAKWRLSGGQSNPTSDGWLWTRAVAGVDRLMSRPPGGLCTSVSGSWLCSTEDSRGVKGQRLRNCSMVLVSPERPAAPRRVRSPPPLAIPRRRLSSSVRDP